MPVKNSLHVFFPANKTSQFEPDHNLAKDINSFFSITMAQLHILLSNVVHSKALVLLSKAETLFLCTGGFRQGNSCS